MHYSFINIIDILPDFLQEVTNGFPNIQKSFGHYLLHLIFGGSASGNTSSIVPNTLQPVAGSFSHSSQESGIREHFLKRVIKKYSPDVLPSITVDDLVPYFMEECAKKCLRIDQNYASYLLHLLIRDIQDGLHFDVKANKSNVSKLDNFLERCLTKYSDSLDATICNTKICYYFKGCHELELDYVKKKYELDSKEKLTTLCKSILQYPETSNPKQLDEMFVKMQIFIISSYYIGCATNPGLLKQTRQSLNSILGKGDLQKYVLKKRYHRLEYLQRLGATVCGILTYNNYKAEGKNDSMRNNLEMAQRNTKDSLDVGLKRAIECIQKGTDAIQSAIQINITQQSLLCKLPLIKVLELNKFIVLFHVYKRCLGQMNDALEKTNYLIEVTQKKFDCVMNKINEILKFRSAIESDLIFPHFVYLSEVWTSLVLFLNHMVEINKIKDRLDELLSEHLENHYLGIVEDISASSKQSKYALELTFDKQMFLNSKGERKHDMKIKPIFKDYCALTMVLTNGLVIPSKLERKFDENVDINFGFYNIEFAKYSEKCFSRFIETFENVIFTSVDLMLLLQLDDDLLQQDFEQSKKKTKTSCTQTASTEESNLFTAKRIDDTWNVWDYHRETIHLANIRQQQTNSTLTNASFGKRNAQNQSHWNVCAKRQN